MLEVKNSLVSVIIATYNYGECITKAIESILAQTYKNLEIIIIDDGSTDNTKGIIGPHIRNNIVKYFYQENTGNKIAWDNAIRRARGKYIAILDADDLWLDKNKLEKQVKFLEDNPDYILTGGGMIITNKYGTEIGRRLYPEHDEDIRASLLLDNMFVHSSVVYRKEAWQKAGGYSGDGPIFLMSGICG